jgi:subtilisin family serine protease
MSFALRRLVSVAATAGLLATAVLVAPTVATGATHTYVILYSNSAVPAGTQSSIAAAGGTLIAKYDAIGVAIARSNRLGFSSTIQKDAAVEGVATTEKFATKLEDPADAADDGPAPGSAPATDNDSLSGLQWDMIQIRTPEAHSITGGSPTILVGDIDTGLDYTHPDLAANVDDAASANCLSGAPVQGKVAANDDNGHGTHTAGTIAAAANGIGIVGVAPNVKIAGIKAGNSDGFFFPEAVICAFMWAGDHGVDITNNSYFADPWYFNCRKDPEQRAILEAEQRAVKYAQKQGALVVVAEGNFSDDLAHPTMDRTSPDDATPVERPVDNSCLVSPVELPGAVGVTANGNKGFKSFYSSYGVVDVIAPGGDSVLQQTPAAPNGRVLSTWPASLLTVTCLPARRLVDPTTGAAYCYQQGTSMASPHVAGVAALIKSQNPKMSQGALAAALRKTADPMACPDTAMYAPFPSVNNDAPQVCTGGVGNNSFNGHGQVNALTAVTK